MKEWIKVSNGYVRKSDVSSLGYTAYQNKGEWYINIWMDAARMSFNESFPNMEEMQERLEQLKCELGIDENL